MVRFLHAADIHLDAPFTGLAEYEGAPVERLRAATRSAFENLINLALAEQVNFVVIAGDLFDGRWTSLQTGLWTAQQFRRLGEIPVFLIRGNHDALSEVPRRISWPANVREFPVDRPGTMELPELHVALHGQGFTARDVRDDVAAGYPPAVPGAFNIGLLHTSLNGDARHDTYAPTSEQVLLSKGYDYWALGHVHQRREVRETPRIAYSGCTQGRHVNEPGAKGCLLVETTGSRLTSTFVPLDLWRWEQVVLDVSDCDDLTQLSDCVYEGLQQVVLKADGRNLAVRVTLRGMTLCHRQLATPAGAEEAVNEVRNRANQLGGVWIEQLLIETLPQADPEQLKASDDLLGELLRDFEYLMQTASDEELRPLVESLQPLLNKAPTELRDTNLDMADPSQIRRWLGQAQRVLLTQFMDLATTTPPSVPVGGPLHKTH